MKPLSLTKTTILLNVSLFVALEYIHAEWISDTETWETGKKGRVI